MKTEQGRTLPPQVWYYPSDRLTFRRKLSPSLQRSLSCPSFSQTSSTTQQGLTHRHLLKGSDVLVLLQEVQNSAVSAPFRVVNTNCHHSSGHQKENADTSRPHYFTVVKHLDIRSLQCSNGATSVIQFRPTKRLLTLLVNWVCSHCSVTVTKLLETESVELTSEDLNKWMQLVVYLLLSGVWKSDSSVIL